MDLYALSMFIVRECIYSLTSLSNRITMTTSGEVSYESLSLEKQKAVNCEKHSRGRHMHVSVIYRNIGLPMNCKYFRHHISIIKQDTHNLNKLT